MNFSRFSLCASAILTLVLLLGAGLDLSAQGRGRGNPPTNPGRGDQPTSNPSTSRTSPSSTSTDRVKSDKSTTKTKSNIPSENELNRYNGISKKLNTTPADLNTQYQAALTTNSKLTFGQFVAANVVADNLHERFPDVTSAAILSGLASGKSIGRTLQDLKVDPSTAKTAEKQAKRQIKDSQKSP